MIPTLATDLENLGYVYFEAERYDLDLGWGKLEQAADYRKRGS